ncbi:unnamed protein product [Nippostrongylus brasiliensis]|uniref:Pepdidase_M14_N domain-containing protein n=1 Tax=Nippostrongylus brasiliensis TaxID=27835 RepID=A0A0N4YGD6_NIPBR|nr:unnamed protein product [Nippostrongylus brasiliensis]
MPASCHSLGALENRLKEVLTRAKSDRKEHRDELNCLAEHADDTVAELILAVGVKDCRLSLKLRVGGVLQLLCSILASDCDSALSQTMTKLLCRCLRSPRNAQLAGRQRGFASRLLVRITSLEGRDPVQSQLLARHLEVLYFVTKNRKTRILLVGEGVTSCVLSLLDHHFLWRNSSNLPEDANDVHVEICLISVAVLRLLCNNKQLVACNVLLLCEQIMNGIEKDGQQCSNAMVHLQDSLCALCLRCLPTLPFPIIGSPFPLRLCFQKASSPTRRGSSTSPVKRCSEVSTDSSTTDNYAEMIEGESSDDDGVDEEDEMLSKLNEDAGAVLYDVDDDFEPSTSDIRHSKLKPSELELYGSFFPEYTNGAEAKPAEVGHVDPNVDHLLFESRFECGNLRRATQVAPNHYELILSPDINQRKEHYQWFYFEVGIKYDE